MADLSRLIARLASADPAARETAAAGLYRLGRALGDPVVQRWRAEPELAGLLAGPPTVGIAVQPENFVKIREALGMPRLAEVPPDQHAQEFEVHTGAAQLDVLTTNGMPGEIARFLEKFGEGIQQVEYVTTDVDRATEILRIRFGEQPLYPQARTGADGTRVNFFLAKAPGGKKALIELVALPRTRRK